MPKLFEAGSALKIDLALHLISLVILTLGAGDNAHEVYRDSLVFIRDRVFGYCYSCCCYQRLCRHRDFCIHPIIWKLMNQESKLPTRDFVDTETLYTPNYMETHESRKQTSILCGCCSISLDSPPFKHHLPSISPKKWKGLIPYLLKQLEDDDEHVNLASIEALALIFENGSLEKFSNQARQHASAKAMKDDIMEHVRRVCNGTKQEALGILEDDYDKTSTFTLGRTRVTISTWSQLKQVSYIRRFLGYGFTIHMMENEHLQNVFCFAPATECSDDLELYKPEFEEVSFRVFMPEVRRENCAKRMHMSPSSLLNKGRTKLRNKYRSLAEETKAGYIADEELD